MPTINEIQDLWVLFAAVIAAGFVAGWLSRTALMRVKQKPIVNLLETTQKVFLINEQSVAKQIQFAVDMMVTLRKFSDASQSASILAEDRMREYHQEFIELYKDNLVPEILEAVKAQVTKLSNDADGGIKRP